MIDTNPDLTFTGERFRVRYTLNDYEEDDARRMAAFICVEQTIEFPYELVPPGAMHDLMVGQVESFEPQGESRFEVVISYANESSGMELPQLLNVIFGNVSFTPGIRVERLDLPASLADAFRGPRFGRKGVRDLIGIYDRPLISTALKPMGLSAEQMAEMAYRCALGGIDIVKDDHGLSDQGYCPFQERISRCVEAVAKANQQTGYRSLYFPCISGRMEEFHKKVTFARDAGADGLMIMPAFSGLDTLRMVAEDDAVGLPVIFHPGFLGTYRRSETFGLSPFVVHGQLSRLMGADITIFPHYGGRFSPPKAECQLALDGTSVPMHHIKPNLPSPAGGVRPEHFEDMRAFYGRDAIFLVASNLHRHSPDLVESSRHFRTVAERLADSA
jgi:ribulose-bisphosphate carboxylase large chain